MRFAAISDTKRIFITGISTFWCNLQIVRFYLILDMKIVRYTSTTDFKIYYMRNSTFWVVLSTSLDSSSPFTSECIYNSIYDILELKRFGMSPFNFRPEYDSFFRMDRLFLFLAKLLLKSEKRSLCRALLLKRSIMYDHCFRSLFILL